MNNTSVDFENLPLERVLSFRINRLSASLGRQATLVLAKESSLSLVEWRLLRMLVHGPSATARDVNRISGMNPAQISRGLRRLELRKLVSTQRDENDRRTLRLKLTPQGRQLYDQGLPVMSRRHQALYSSLSPEEHAVFTQILDKLEAHAQVLDFPATEQSK
jgi:DNA-binding MarR family transcriptional regulator